MGTSHPWPACSPCHGGRLADVLHAADYPRTQKEQRAFPAISATLPSIGQEGCITPRSQKPAGSAMSTVRQQCTCFPPSKDAALHRTHTLEAIQTSFLVSSNCSGE